MGILGSCEDLQKLYEETKCCKFARFEVVTHRRDTRAHLLLHGFAFV